MSSVGVVRDRRVNLRGSFLARAYAYVTELHSVFLAGIETSDHQVGLLAASKASQDALWSLYGIIEAVGAAKPSVMSAWSAVEAAATQTVMNASSDQIGPGSATWLTKPEASRYVGRSIKTLERYVKEGRIHKKLVQVEGRKPLPMLNKSDLDNLRPGLNVDTQTADLPGKFVGRKSRRET